jgi:hypothetical protein
MSVVVWLPKGQFTVVDDVDFARFGHLKWTTRLAPRTGYALVNGKCLHRMILDAPQELEVDHIDGDGFNNLRSNLRLATHSQNQHNHGLRRDNTSGFKGVCREHTSGLWEANIKLHGRQHKLGRFKTPELAYAARCLAAQRMHGAFARSDDW